MAITKKLEKLGIIGAGAWGTALAAVGARAGLDSVIWARETEVVDAINKKHENIVYLKNHPLPKDLRATNDLSQMADRDFILMVAPAQHMRASTEALKPHINSTVPLLICAKGIEVKSGQLMSQVIRTILPDNPLYILSGPTFAHEVAKGLPCALTLASETTKEAKTRASQIAQKLSQPDFRLYLSDDLIGAQIGGAVKNILAVATGMVAGLGYGENARAALITRGLAEMTRFGALFGAKKESLMGLSGLGDLILTCSSEQSRNMSLGKAIGEGQNFKELMQNRQTVAEGAYSAEIVAQIARKNHLDMPISDAVYQILHLGADVQEVTKQLLARPAGWENNSTPTKHSPDKKP